MSNVSQTEASQPSKKMQECFKCKAAGFPNQLIGFEKIGENPTTGKGIWKLIDENGNEHQHMVVGGVNTSPASGQTNTATVNQQPTEQSQQYKKPYDANRPIFKRKRVIDIAVVTDIAEARKLLAQGWDFQDSYPATISNIPHHVLVRKE